MIYRDDAPPGMIETIKAIGSAFHAMGCCLEDIQYQLQYIYGGTLPFDQTTILSDEERHAQRLPPEVVETVNIPKNIVHTVYCLLHERHPWLTEDAINNMTIPQLHRFIKSVAETKDKDLEYGGV